MEVLINLIIQSWFDRIIAFFILLNTVLLTLQDYSFRIKGESENSPTINNVFNYYNILKYLQNIFDYIFIAVFLFEFVLKVVAYGFATEKYTYIRDGWNVIDFAVVVTR